mgnify:CR=1 FL=1
MRNESDSEKRKEEKTMKIVTGRNSEFGTYVDNFVKDYVKSHYRDYKGSSKEHVYSIITSFIHGQFSLLEKVSHDIRKENESMNLLDRKNIQPISLINLSEQFE